jgi:hypothetical protein
VKIRIDAFQGIAPKLSPNLLPTSAGQDAQNLRMNSGSLKPINTPSLESNKIIAGATSVYMLGVPGSQFPMSWVNDVDVVASPISDSEYKIYYTGDGLPKKTYLSIANTGVGPYPATWLFWSVPTPTTAPTLGSTTGSVAAGTYSYVFTYVTQFGATLQEESMPSPAQIITLASTGGVTVTFPTNPSTTNRNYTLKRVYRTTGSVYQMVAEVSFGTASVVDNIATPTATTLPSADWTPIKDDLQGVITLPSGVMAGFRANELWFCEPGYPHAWPVKYMQTFDDQIVGIKSFGNTIVVATLSYPYSGSGLDPSSFTFSKLSINEPCLSKRSMAADQAGVFYVSQNGIVLIGDSFVGVASAKFVSRDTFYQFAPDTITGIVYEGRYYGFYKSATYGNGTIVFAKTDSAPFTKLSLAINGATVDRRTARLLYLDYLDGFLYRFDPPDTLPYTYSWKSKVFQLPFKESLGCFRVLSSEVTSAEAASNALIAAQNTAITASNATLFTGDLNTALNSNYLNQLPLNESLLQALIPLQVQTVGVTLWAARTAQVTKNCEVNTVYRIPATRALSWEISITGQREVYAIEMATSPQELINPDAPLFTGVADA